MIQRIFWAVALGCCLAGRAGEGKEILLHASGAIVHGEKLRYEPETNKICLGYWTNPADWAEWKFKVERPAVYELEVWQGCGKGNGGSDVRVEVAGQTFDFVVDETGHFQSFIPRKLGRVHFGKAGEFALAIKPQNKKGAAVMDIRQIKLLKIPEEGDSSIAAAILKARRVVFLGDSITYAGEHLELFETHLRLMHPHAEFDLINLGLPSETVSGLSEPGHAGGAFPRPDLHERLDRVLELAKPDLILACYGMNDGIYHPFSEDRFSRFKEGIVKLREKAAAAGAKVIHLTPPVFDAQVLKGQTLPAGLSEYKQPFEGYNEVLDIYSDWLISKHADGWEAIDLHGPMNAALAEGRANDANFRFANDGVHPNSSGHWLMARALGAFSGSGSGAGTNLSPNALELLKAVQQRQRLRKDAWLTHVGHLRPKMEKGKPLDEAEREADQWQGKIASLQDPQFPGRRILSGGFEVCEFQFDGEMVKVALPWRSLTPALWFSSESSDFTDSFREIGQGYHGVIAPNSVSASFEKELTQRYGWPDLEFCKKVRPVIERHSPVPRDASGRPLIRKLGTVDMDLVETTPVVISNRLWRFEWVREGYWDNKRKTNYFRFRDPTSGEVTAAFADGHEFGSSFVNDGIVYVTGTLARGEVNVFASRDLKTWEKWNAIPGGRHGIFNTSICQAGPEFVMMFEIDKPVEEAGAAFTARFAKSPDLRAWRVTPPEFNYAKDRYTAPHALRWLDGWFYNFYLEAHDGYEMRVVRSRDLAQWEPSPLNPVLKASPEDKRIAHPEMSSAHRTRTANAVNLNNSDIDFCEFQGQLHITYSWGNQQGIEHLAEAIYDGTEAEFLKGWFPRGE